MITRLAPELVPKISFWRKSKKMNGRPASRLDLTKVNVLMFRQPSAQVSAAVTRNEADSQGTNQKPDTEIYSHVPQPQA